MNAKLIMLPNPIVVSSERIKVGDSYHTSDYRIVKWLQDLEDASEGMSFERPKPIIAGIEGLPTVNLSLVADEIGWVDVISLVNKEYNKHPNNDYLYGDSEDLQMAYKAGVLDGVKAHQSLNEKKFSEEELKDALFYALNKKSHNCCITDTRDSVVREAIKYLSQPKVYNVSIIQENNSITVTKILK